MGIPACVFIICFVLAQIQTKRKPIDGLHCIGPSETAMFGLLISLELVLGLMCNVSYPLDQAIDSPTR
jgi:hypothetical protein